MSRICFDRAAPCARWLGHLGPSDWGFLYQRFSSPVGNEACQFRNQQSRTTLRWRPWFYLVLAAHSSGYPRGPRVLSETACPKHTSPNFSAETRSRTRCLENPTATAREKIPRMEQTRSETLKLFVVSDDWRRNTLLSSRRSERSWQFSWLRSVVPFPAACPWPVKPNKTLRRGLAWSQRQPPHP